MSASRLFQISGRVIDVRTGRPIADLHIEAWDKDLLTDDFVGSDTTDEQGAFRINFTEEHFREFFADRRPDLFFRIFRGERLIRSTEDSVLCNLDSLSEELILEVEEDGTDTLGRVSGRVLRADRSPLAGVTVRAIDRQLREERALGEGESEADGRYQIEYARPAGRGVNLLVRVARDGAGETTASEIRFNAQPEEVLDVTLPAGDQPSDYERELETLSPALAGVRLEDVRDQELGFLARAAGLEPARVALLRDGARLAAEADLPAEIFYGILRSDRATDPSRIWTRPVEDLVAAVGEAVRRGIVPRRLGERMEELAAGLSRRRIGEMLRPARDGAPPSLGDLLATMRGPLSAKEQRGVAEAVADSRARGEELLDRLREAGLGREQAVGVGRTLRLHDLTRGSLPLVRRLQEVAADDQDASLRSLAALRRDEWIDLAYASGAPDGSGVAPEGYAAELETRVEELHPTATLRARLAEGALLAELPGLSGVEAFLKQNPDFDIVTANLEALPAEASRARAADGDQTLRSLRALQRIKKLSATWEEAGVLLEAGLDSALDIVNLGRDRLRERISGRIDPGRADVLFDRAKGMHDASLALMVQVLPRFTRDQVALMPASGIDGTPLAAYPTLQGLFGALDSCETRHCRSVLGPAAYFVDLLEFLKPSPEAFGALLRRRPDLADLELSCENSEIELPHIDLVLEVLENAVALPLTVELPAGVDGAAALSATPLPEVITNVLRRTVLQLGEGLKAEREERQLLSGSATEWTVQDRHRRWTLRHSVDALYARPAGSPRARRLPLEGIDVEQLVSGLEQGRILPAARIQFEALLASATPQGRNLRLTSYELVPIEAGRRWKVTFRFGADVELEGRNGRIRLALRTPGGEEIVSHTYSERAADATARELRRGAVGGVLAALLPKRRDYRVSKRGQRWRIETAEAELEVRYTPERLTVAALAYQSSGKSEDLRVSPANRNLEAYERLREAKFPWTLPFDLPLLEVRELLSRSGTSRLRVMELLRPSTYLSDHAIAQESLGISQAEAELITTAAAVPDLWDHWGLAEGPGGTVVIRDASADERVTGEPLEVLSRVSILLQQARIDSGDLRDLLQTRFVAPPSEGTVTIEPEAECQPSRMRLSGLTPQHLDRMHRFLRLRRRLGWRTHELDLALAAVQPGSTDVTETLRNLSHVERLRGRLGLPVEVIASWWGGLGTPVYREHTREGQPEIQPLYDRLFLSPLVRSLPDPDFRLDGGRTGLVPGATGKTLTDKATFIAAALGTLPPNVLELVAPSGPVPDELSLPNLSHVHRAVSLSTALGLTVPEYLDVVRLTRLNPFQSPQAAITFCDAVELIRGSGIGLQHLLYLLLHEPAPEATAVLGAERETRLLVDLRAALHAKRSETEAGFNDPYLQAQLGDLAVMRVADLFGLDAPTASELLRVRLQHPAAAGSRAVDVLRKQEFVESDPTKEPTATEFVDARALLRRLHKVALLVRTLSLTPAELSWLADGGDAPKAMDVLDLNQLPTSPPESGGDDLFAPWQRLVVLVGIRDLAPGSAAMLAEYIVALANPDLAAARKALAAGLSLTEEMVEDAAQEIGVATLADYRNPLRLRDLLQLLVTLKRLGATVEEASALAEPTPTSAAGAVVGNLLRASRGAEVWRGQLQAMSDVLRVKQRDALVDYLLHRDSLQGPDELYQRYLVDVQMAPCMATTRILQGIGTIQLFVQRSLLNLEPGVSPTAIDRGLWDWMKSYRVWEANRKVFLFPENWLSPELRDDQTEIFRELASALSQAEPSHENASDALLTYLDQLNELAQITVLGMYEDQQTLGQEIRRVLYVVGRSPDQPYRYFWRRCEEFGTDRMLWSGWERVDLDISTDHVIPFVSGGDLHIAWPIVRKTREEGETGRWELRLAWARHTTGGWTRKKISRDPVTTDIRFGRNEHNGLAFRAVPIRLPLSLAGSGSGDDGCGIAAHTDSVTIHCYAAEAEAPRGVKPQNRPPQQFESPVANLLVLGTAFVRFTSEGETVYDYARGAKVEFDVVAREGQSLLSRDIVRTYLGAPRRLPDTDNSGRFMYAAAATGPLAERFAEVSFVVRVSFPPDSAAGPDPLRLDMQTGLLVCNWYPEVVFEGTEQSRPAEMDPEQPVEMAWKGAFVLTGSGDVYRRLEGAVPLEKVEGALPYAGGYRELEPAPLRLSAGDGAAPVSVFQETPDRFFVTRAASEASAARSGEPTRSTWHYRDSGGRYYLQLRNAADPQVVAVADGHAYVSAFRSSAAASLEALFGCPALQAISDGGQKWSSRLPAREPLKSSIVADAVHFDLRSPYAAYNWELFLHAPLLAADHLMRQQRFEDARRWLHLVFDPTTSETGTGATRFWGFLPFREAGGATPVEQLLSWLAQPGENDSREAEFRNQIATWKRNPFRPHAVARMRRGAYQWSTLFTYLDNLIAWGDQLFRRDTRESVNEATQLYVLAAQILGPRPRSTPSRVQAPPMTYRALAGRWDAFSNAWYAFADHPLVKQWLDLQEWLEQHGILGPRPLEAQTQVLTSLGTMYFSVPQNEKLLGYWGKVEDRLFKIRNCLDLQGAARDLPLWEAPIDPALLIRAAAAGVNVPSVLADRDAPLSSYRFSVVLQRALEICGELRSLGAALLSALEKKDAEQIALLRSSNEVELLRLSTTIRRQQVEEANSNLEALRQSEAAVSERFMHYQRLLGNTAVTLSADGLPVMEQSSSLRVATDASGEPVGMGLIPNEIAQLTSLDRALTHTVAGGIFSTLAGILHAIPNTHAGTPVFTAEFGGSHLGSIANALAAAAGTEASISSHHANRASLFAQYQRRSDEWIHQSRAAVEELKQLRTQRAAAEIRLAMAQRELENHHNQIQQAEGVDAFMREKYTNRELYTWMVDQTSDVYFRTYQLAHDVAKRAERCFQFELGLAGSRFVQFDHWDSLKMGLLAGERLYHDLKRMDAAYLERNTREYEITKHVSLVLHDPMALITLKETGQCEVALPEAVFDLDYPGHYLRRIRSVALSIPAVTGPYTSVNCTLTLVNNRIRFDKTDTSAYPEQGPPDPRFHYDFAATQSIATSHGQGDTGMFEMSFRDERYLPFEGAGAISKWRIEIPKDCNTFDFDTISDLVLRISYTAQDGGAQLRQLALAAAQLPPPPQQPPSAGATAAVAKQPNLRRMFSVRHEFAAEWHQFLRPNPAAGKHSLELSLTPERFPYRHRRRSLKVGRLDLFLKLRDLVPGGESKSYLELYDRSELEVNVTLPDGSTVTSAPTLPTGGSQNVKQDAALNGLLHGIVIFDSPPGAVTGVAKWKIVIGSSTISALANALRRDVTDSGASYSYLKPEAIEDLVLVCHYSVT